MPVKYWSRAGLILSYWCNARCPSCYLCCSPRHSHWMSVENALTWWEQLIRASPHGCRIHLTGGEPMGNWPVLSEICRRARSQGLRPLEKIETNGDWAVNDATIRQRLSLLDEAGMEKLSISADPYHQMFVPIDRVRKLARLASEILGPKRVQVRWEDWLVEAPDVRRLTDPQRRELLADFANKGRDRWAGRAADVLAQWATLKCASEFVDKSCHGALLRSKHVHVDPEGLVMPGTCGGIVLGRLQEQSVEELWSGLESDYASRPVVGVLAASGPVGLAEASGRTELARGRFASKCALCRQVRRRLVVDARGGDELAPAWLYREESEGFGNQTPSDDVQ